MGGGGRLLQYYKERAAYLGLEKNVDFAGYIPIERVPEHYRNCNLFVLPSISASQEGFGIVSLEAMACGKPIVTTDIVGTAEDIKKYNSGIVIKPMDTKGLANAIIRILQDKKEAEKMGERGRKLVEEKYTWENISKDIEDIYLDVI